MVQRRIEEGAGQQVQLGTPADIWRLMRRTPATGTTNLGGKIASGALAADPEGTNRAVIEVKNTSLVLMMFFGDGAANDDLEIDIYRMRPHERATEVDGQPYSYHRAADLALRLGSTACPEIVHGFDTVSITDSMLWVDAVVTSAFYDITPIAGKAVEGEATEEDALVVMIDPAGCDLLIDGDNVDTHRWNGLYTTL